MPQFMMLLYDSEENLATWMAMSPEEQQEGIAPYAAWSERLAAQGKLRGGEKLRDGSGRVLRGTSEGMRVTDGPFAETKEVIGGYFVLEAADYDEAVRLAGDCPQLEHGGTIEIREIEPIPSAQPA
jgi:hypothetical protein